jgi:MSHA pilin protein MshD
MSQPAKKTTMICRARHQRLSRPRRGMTMVEVAFSSFLVGLMLVATMNAVAAVFRTRLEARQGQQGKALARELMAEIFQGSYQDPQSGSTTFGPESNETGTTRANFDDVDDYDQYADSPPQDKSGILIPNCSGWSRHVDIERVLPAAPRGVNPSETGFKRITVTVTSPAGENTVLIAYRSSAGVNEYIPPLDRTYITGVRGVVKIGTGSLSATGQAPVVNQAEDN